MIDAVAGSKSCTPCQSGKFSNHNPGGTACENTASPTSSPTQSPTRSPTTSPTAAPTPCVPGTHKNAQGGGGCIPCEEGTHYDANCAHHHNYHTSHSCALVWQAHIRRSRGWHNALLALLVLPILILARLRLAPVCFVRTARSLLRQVPASLGVASLYRSNP